MCCREHGCWPALYASTWLRVVYDASEFAQSKLRTSKCDCHDPHGVSELTLFHGMQSERSALHSHLTDRMSRALRLKVESEWNRVYPGGYPLSPSAMARSLVYSGDSRLRSVIDRVEQGKA
eukprot:7391318-Prymnesium_polylepis.1